MLYLTFTAHASHPRELGWWNGRHVRLRGVCRKACGFKSRPEHDLKSRPETSRSRGRRRRHPRREAVATHRRLRRERGRTTTAIRPFRLVSLPIIFARYGIALSDWRRGAGGLRIGTRGHSF